MKNNQEVEFTSITLETPVAVEMVAGNWETYIFPATYVVAIHTLPDGTRIAVRSDVRKGKIGGKGFGR